MLGLRHEWEERRHRERRSEARPTRDRRRSQRRRARLRSLMFTALALVLPYQMKEKPLAWFGGSLHSSGPRVTTSIESAAFT